MSFRKFALAAALGIAPIGGASAQIVINQAAVLAGGITPGDAPGFPATLSRSGAYRLSGNLTPPAGAGAIEIVERNVSLDLGGHVIDGGNRCNVASTTTPGAGCPSLSGTTLVSVLRLPARIVNGSVIGGMQSGIEVGSGVNGFVGERLIGLHLADLDVAHNGAYGIFSDVEGVQMRNVTLQRNAAASATLRYPEAIVVGLNTSHGDDVGIIASDLVAENVVTSYNASVGISVGDGTIRMADASSNTRSGFAGGFVASNVSAANNGNYGLVIPMLAHEVVANDNVNTALDASFGAGCYARVYVRTTSAVTPQVIGDPLHGTITSCP